ncbi:MAG TPA: GNAT family N-acetyltransferase [Candidatus Dormibacteraeota bacterium]|jgi:RimJ/RimL family protein N-acetyltransferase|nr:GNAT family N-acetyltransferase [Candidatus Dormibacteraeota bacterium]
MTTPATPLLRRVGRTRSGREYVIRPAGADDAAALVALRDAVAGEGRWVAAEPGERTVLEESLALAGLLSHGGLSLVAELDGALAGQLAVQRRLGGYEGHRGDLSITVAREHREQGLGRALVETAIDWARAVHLGKLTLGVFPENVRAIALYRSVGFVEEGRLGRHLRVGGEFRDLVLMGLLLAPRI